ncbi:MAG: 16S rRNA processing protein RimM [Sulfobacillus benefaciens]|uniref:Ribosome maturation factor RimM n=1 Tax=Sulfobacillus benefaciens TaxID=453960 RepID=A0A2T2XJF3_9FIRM|nr:MAG: 16S rRNA processing protein RimM [Sulfobacillus benefaciens]
MSSHRPQDHEGFVMVGEIVGVHGIDGTMKVYPTTDFVDRLVHRKSVWVSSDTQPVAVVEAKTHNNVVLMRLASVRTREQGLLMRGKTLWVPVEELPPLPEGEYYWHQLLGMQVEECDTGRVLGTLQHVIRSGQHHDLFEVDRPSAKPLLIPALRAVVRDVDVEAKVMRVVLPEGLEDAT